MNIKPSTQIEISAQVWECQACGGRDSKSCSCNSTAIMVALRSDAAKYADQKEAARQKKARQRAASRDTSVENTKESDNGSVVPVVAPIPSRFERKRTAELLRLVDCLITADLARDLLGELKAHGPTFLIEELEHRLSSGRDEEDENSPAATDTIN
jgi:hypothetical protein